eukprot:TRINITY_DN773197_c0_g1_i1.p1 TRINITY_DN773197_c0_g1~~TRINITY_DN773197_c0_g1_i1.p1  ORF type:complete len:163 (-),score=18.23 TRINITY_DN773197_c0_g1_i1:6-494(-)
MLLNVESKHTDDLDQSILTLISKYPEEDLQIPLEGTTYLLAAIDKGNPVIVDVLMRHASMNCLEFGGSRGTTTLAKLLEHYPGRTDPILKCIDTVSKAHLYSFRNNDLLGSTYLMLAAHFCSDVNVFKALLKNAPSEWIARGCNYTGIHFLHLMIILVMKRI